MSKIINRVEDIPLEYLDNWRAISIELVLTEDFIRDQWINVDRSSICKHQVLSEDFIRQHSNSVIWLNIGRYQNLSNEFVNEFSNRMTEHTLLKSVHHCGRSNRVIYRTKAEPDIIHIGCTSYSKDEAIAAISEEYSGEEKEVYINKVLECFEYNNK